MEENEEDQTKMWKLEESASSQPGDGDQPDISKPNNSDQRTPMKIKETKSTMEVTDPAWSPRAYLNKRT